MTDESSIKLKYCPLLESFRMKKRKISEEGCEMCGTCGCSEKKSKKKGK